MEPNEPQLTPNIQTTQPSVENSPKNYTKIILLSVIGLLLVGTVAGAYYLKSKNTWPPNGPIPIENPESCPPGSTYKGGICFIGGTPKSCSATNKDEICSTVSDETANWKTFNIENITFNYPNDWTDPEIFPTNSGLSGVVKTADGYIEVGVHTGGNKGHSSKVNEEFIKRYASDEGKILLLDNSLAGIRGVELQGVKTITVYIAAKDKLSVYSIYITSPQSLNLNTEELFDQILSTFRFTP